MSVSCFIGMLVTLGQMETRYWFRVSRPDAKECLERTDHHGPHVEVIVESALFSRPPDGLWQFDGRFDATVCALH
jgi:hypothetical protein